VVEDGRAVGVDVIDSARAYAADAAHSPSDRTRERVRVTARREVILCGGAVNTPQLLMLSGIGPAAHLAEHGIAIAQDLPGVRHNLQDHIEVAHVDEIGKLPNKTWRWQSTLLAGAGPQFSAHADPSSLTENYVPLVIDWFSGFEERDPLHPDLHMHLMTVYFRD